MATVVKMTATWLLALKPPPKAGLTDITIHDLRRTLGSWQAGAGVSLQIIGKSLCHTSISSTKVYSRLALDPVRSAVQNATDTIEKIGREIKYKECEKLDS